MSQQEESVENIFGDSLELLVGQDLSETADDGQLVFGPLRLTVAPKEGKFPSFKANTLLADHIFSPAFLLAERIERGLINLSRSSGRPSHHAAVLSPLLHTHSHLNLAVELGSGTALPCLLASTLVTPPALVVVTDYPDDVIINNLQSNVDRNLGSISPHCTVECRGYEWGKDPSHLLRLLSSQGRQQISEGYDAVILSDLLHFDRSHGALLDSVCMLLARNDKARVYVAVGVYTKSDVCAAFLRQAERCGLVWIDKGAGQDGQEVDDVWRGTLPVQGMSREQLGARKGMCRWWVARWSDEQL